MDWSQLFGPDFQQWYAGLQQMGTDNPLDPNAIANIGNLLGLGGLYDQFQQMGVNQQGYDTQRQHDQFQNQQDIRQNDYQNRLLDFQMGPGMDLERLQTQNQTIQSNNNVAISHDDLLKAAEYLKQQQYGTEAASYQRDIARYQAMQSLGLAPAQGLTQPSITQGHTQHRALAGVY